MRQGKLSNEDLEELLLSRFHSKRPEVLVPPGIGLDCCTIDLGDSLCVLTSDPITGSAEKLGVIAVHVCCNDAAAAGAEPVGIMTTLLLPPSITKPQIRQIAEDIANAADIAGIDVLGGHTEITDAVTRPVLSATVIAKIARGKRLINSSGMQVGDDLVMTKWAGLEGCIIIESDFHALLEGVLTPQERANISSWSRHLSVVAEGRAAAEMGAHALHDATEGGILGAAWEMAAASSCGLKIDLDKIAVKEETLKITKALNLDPYKLIASGSMLIGCKDGELICKELAKLDIDACIIGKAVEREKGITVDGELLPPPESDELWKLF